MTTSKLRITLTILARRDVRNALRYSGRQWGQEQRRTYRQAINRALETLRTNPEIGGRREEIFVGCRTFPVGHHLVFYRVDATRIIVSRVLHAHQDSTAAVFDLHVPDSEY